MANFTSSADGVYFATGVVVTGNATKASDHNTLNDNCLLFKSCKAGVLPGNDTDCPQYNESGLMFDVWLTMDDGDTQTLVDASNYTGIGPPSFASNGFADRWIQCEMWYHNAASVTEYVPGGTNVDGLNGSADKQFGMWGEDGKTYSFVDGNYTYTFDLNASGDFTLKFDDSTHNDDAAVHILITCGPRYETS